MEPLSIMASVAGIFSATLKISSVASSLISRWKEAPTSIHGIVAEMSALAACLVQLKPYLQGIETASSSRTAAISVEQIVIVTSCCVLAVSELQKTLETLEPGKPTNKKIRLRWASQGRKIDTLRSRVQASTSSLNLILTVITCSTAEESRKSINKLERTVEHILQNDTDSSTRLLESSSDTQSNRYAASICQNPLDVSDKQSIITVKGVTSTQKAASEKREPPTYGLDPNVEHGLFSSIVYLRADGRHSLSSLQSKSGAGSRYGWSFFSDFSLDQISNLSVVSLPISCQELWNPELYVVSNQIENAGDCDPPWYSNKDAVLSSPVSSLRPRRGSGSSLPSIFNNLLGGKSAARHDAAELRKPSALLDQKSALEKDANGPSFNVLLLGAGEAGKSTLLRQMRRAYEGGLSRTERLEYRHVVRSNLLAAFQSMLEELHFNNFNLLNPMSHVYERILIEALDTSVAFGNGSAEGPPFFPECLIAMKGLWMEESVQQIFKHGNEWALSDNFTKLFQDVDRIAAPEYVPTEDDILRSRQRTLGIIEIVCVPNSVPSVPGNQILKIVDVGGARSERKKWIHAANNINIPVFIAPLSGYDQCLIEDKMSFQLQEALRIFESILETQWLEQPVLILILSKIDLLAHKLKVNPVENYWPDYDGPPNDPQHVADFFAKKFCGLGKRAGRKIKVFQANLIDTETTTQLLADILRERWPYSKDPRGTTKHRAPSKSDQSDDETPKKSERRQVDFLYTDFSTDECISFSQGKDQFGVITHKEQQEQSLQSRLRRRITEASSVNKEHVEHVRPVVPQRGIMVKTEWIVESHDIAHKKQQEDPLQFQSIVHTEENEPVSKEQAEQTDKGATRLGKEVTIKWDSSYGG